MFNSKRASANITVLIALLIVTLLLLILMYTLVSQPGGETMCKESPPLTAVTSSAACYNDQTTTILLDFNEPIDSFKINAIHGTGSKTIIVSSGEKNSDIKQFGRAFGDMITLPDTGIVLFELKGVYNLVEVFPITDDRLCAQHVKETVPISQCNVIFTSAPKIDLSDQSGKVDFTNNGGGSNNGGDGSSGDDLSVTITVPEQGQVFGVSEIPLEFETEGNPDSCYYKLNNQPSVNVPNCENAIVVTEGEGQHTLTVVAEKAGESASDVVSFVVDFSVLVISDVTTNPELPFVTNESFTLIVDFESNHFPLNVTFDLYDESQNNVDTQGPILIQSDSDLPVEYIVPGGLADGVYSLYMTVVDLFGNEEIIYLGDIIIQTTLPAERCGGAGEDQLILKLYSETNTHGEVWNGPYYEIEICYNDIFGELYSGDNPHQCTETNKVLGLARDTNAHAEIPSLDNYETNVCYGNLVCEARPACEEGEQEIVALSQDTNAHLELPGQGNYNTHICCSLA